MALMYLNESSLKIIEEFLFFSNVKTDYQLKPLFRDRDALLKLKNEFKKQGLTQEDYHEFIYHVAEYKVFSVRKNSKLILIFSPGLYTQTDFQSLYPKCKSKFKTQYYFDFYAKYEGNFLWVEDKNETLKFIENFIENYKDYFKILKYRNIDNIQFFITDDLIDLKKLNKLNLEKDIKDSCAFLKTKEK